MQYTIIILQKKTYFNNGIPLILLKSNIFLKTNKKC
jgi:hypothetical protein